MTAHTPGPWAVEDARRVLGSTDYGRSVMRDAEVEANARLIAAAPDMLAALRRLLDCPALRLEGHEYEDELAIDLARHAIAKAEGALCGK